MKNIIIILLVLFSGSAFATTHIICTGSGSCSVTSQGSFASGDTLLIATQTGTYTFFNFSNLHNLVILPQSGRPIFTAASTFKSNTFCELGFITFSGFTGNAINWSGTNINNIYFHNLSFINVNGYCMQSDDDTFVYTYGDSTTYQAYKLRIDSVYEFQCQMLWHDTFGSIADNHPNPPNVCDSVIITRFISINTIQNYERGAEVRGNIFRCDFHDWLLIDLTNNGAAASGDCGAAYIWGNGVFHHFYKWGGVAYLGRIFCTQQNSAPRSVYCYDCFRSTTTTYGEWDVRNDTVSSISGQISNCSAYIYYNTVLNTNQNDSYAAPLAMIGGFFAPWQPHAKGNIACNTDVAGAANHVIIDLGGNTVPLDTVGNYYFPTAAAAHLDSSQISVSTVVGNFFKYVPTALSVQILGKGLNPPFPVTVDFYGNPRPLANNNTPGYAEFVTAIPPCANCIPKYRGQGIIFKSQ